MIKLLSTDFDGTIVDHEATPSVQPDFFEMLDRRQIPDFVPTKAIPGKPLR